MDTVNHRFDKMQDIAKEFANKLNDCLENDEGIEINPLDGLVEKYEDYSKKFSDKEE